MNDASPFSRFQALLSEIFQFETGDLDFGIYRILNAKRQQVETFITNDLQNVVDQAFAQYAETKSAVASGDLEAERVRVIATLGDDAFDAEGQLALVYQNTRIGKEYLGKEQAASYNTATDSLKAKVYNDLLTFFSRYYDDGDFLPLRRAGREMTYAIPYNGEEVTLYWANKGQYYIKTDDRLAAYTFRAGQFHVALEVRAAQTEQNNNKGAKRYYLLANDDADAPAVRFDEDKKTLHIFFVQRPLTEAEEKEFGKAENQRPQDKLNMAASQAVLARVSDTVVRGALAAPYAPKEGETVQPNTPATLLRHLSQFTKKNTADFFIHKNLSAFLRAELDQFIKTECLRLDELLNGGEGNYALQTARARATKQVGEKIITLLASVEDFQKKLFEKRKFVLRTDYVFTLDRVPAALHTLVLANTAQVQEWRDLYDIDGLLAADGVLGTGGLTLEALQAEPYRRLPVDTRQFDAKFKAELLGSVDDLDTLTDGVLFNSENFQALNLMTNTYRERVKCIYIDPPYNTGSDGFIYKDSYRHSSWLSLMADRISNSLPLLSADAFFLTSIDDIEAHNLMTLQKAIFGGNHFLGVLTWEKRTKAQNTETAKRMLQSKVEQIQAFRTNTDQQKFNLEIQSQKTYSLQDEHGVYRLLEVGQMAADGIRGRETMVYPIRDIMPRTGMQWKIGREEIARLEAERRVVMLETKPYVIYRPDDEDQSSYTPFWSHFLDKDVYGTAETGLNEVRSNLGFGRTIETVKPIKLLMKLLFHFTGGSDLVLDFFAGSGTTGHAVINLNREDEQRETARNSEKQRETARKYILCEMGMYFDSILLPRLKKAAFASGWRDGKPTSRDAVSQTIKYHTLEQYEDTLNNLQLRAEEQSQQALDVYGEDYLLRYMLDFDTNGSPSLLNIAALADPFAYTLRVKSGDDFVHQAVDLPETFSYLLGLRVRKVRAFADAGREYRAVLGEKDGRQIAHIWRKSSDLADDADGLKRDAAFLAETVLPTLAPARPDRVFVNGAFTLPDAENCEPELFRLMFAPVGA